MLHLELSDEQIQWLAAGLAEIVAKHLEQPGVAEAYEAQEREDGE